MLLFRGSPLQFFDTADVPRSGNVVIAGQRYICSENAFNPRQLDFANVQMTNWTIARVILDQESTWAHLYRTKAGFLLNCFPGSPIGVVSSCGRHLLWAVRAVDIERVERLTKKRMFSSALKDGPTMLHVRASAPEARDDLVLTVILDADHEAADLRLCSHAAEYAARVRNEFPMPWPATGGHVRTFSRTIPASDPAAPVAAGADTTVSSACQSAGTHPAPTQPAFSTASAGPDSDAAASRPELTVIFDAVSYAGGHPRLPRDLVEATVAFVDDGFGVFDTTGVLADIDWDEILSIRVEASTSTTADSGHGAVRLRGDSWARHAKMELAFLTVVDTSGEWQFVVADRTPAQLDSALFPVQALYPALFAPAAASSTLPPPPDPSTSSAALPPPRLLPPPG